PDFSSNQHHHHHHLHTFPTRRSSDLASTTVKFDTYDPAFIWEAEDYDYNNGQVVSSPQTNGYAGLAGVSGVDFVNIDDSPNETLDRKSTRLNSSHVAISYAVFCLKKK